MSDIYNGLKVGDKVWANEGSYLLEVLYLGEIADGGVWAMIPSTQPRVYLRTVIDYPDMPKGSEYNCHPLAVKKT